MSTLDIDDTKNTTTEEVELPYQIHRRMMGWKLTNPSRRRDLIGMLDIVHKQRPVDLLMGGSSFKKIPSLKKLEQQIQYLQDYEKNVSTYASAAPGSPLYYLG